MIPTDELIRRMMPAADARLEPHLPFIAPALERGRITTPDRLADFFAQLSHESGEYRFMEELASGEDYEHRTDLGNTPEDDGDGPWFKGHGPMQVTGRRNHEACGRWLGIDLVANPRLLCEPQYATASAVWFWTVGNGGIDLNLLADRGWFLAETRIINGGTNGLADRVKYRDRNRVLLGLPLRSLAGETGDVIAFQRANGLVADGAVGPKTLAMLKQRSTN